MLRKIKDGLQKQTEDRKLIIKRANELPTKTVGALWQNSEATLFLSCFIPINFNFVMEIRSLFLSTILLTCIEPGRGINF